MALSFRAPRSEFWPSENKFNRSTGAVDIYYSQQSAIYWITYHPLNRPTLGQTL